MTLLASRTACRAGITALAVAALAFGVVGCGSSKAPGVVLAPQAGLTHVPITTPKTTTTPATTTTPTTTTEVPTPTSGPLSKEPSFKVPTGPAPTTLKITNEIVGTGATIEPGDEVAVNYVGKLYSNGKVFDSSWSRHQTLSFKYGSKYGQVIPGWEQGLAGMKVGGRRELIIPPSLAYKKAGSGPVPPNATLVFVVDLLSVEK